MNELWKHHAKWKQPHSVQFINTASEWEIRVTENRLMVA